jgi:glycerate dehydrogenase
LKIVYLDSATLQGKDLSFQGLEDLGTLQVHPRSSKDQIIPRSQDVDVLIVNKVVIDKTVIDACPQLKYIIVSATGYNNVDIQYAAEKNIPVSNVRGYSTEGVVQHVFSMMLNGVNRVAYYNSEVKSGRWEKNLDFCFYDHSIRELNGKVLGIYGLGTIGRRVAQIAQAFGMKVIAYHRNKEKLIHPVAEMVSIKKLLCESDILSLHAPLNQESEHFINERNLAKMKDGAIIINTARGGLIDEEALYYALANGKLAFAALDTLNQEPPIDGNQLIGLNNCIITPHQAWAGFESRQRLLQGLIENIKAYKANKVINQVN